MRSVQHISGAHATGWGVVQRAQWGGAGGRCARRLPRHSPPASPPASQRPAPSPAQHVHRAAPHLGGLDLAVAQHLCDQAPDQRLALVGGAPQAGHPHAVPHGKHLAAVLRGIEGAAAAAATGVGCRVAGKQQKWVSVREGGRGRRGEGVRRPGVGGRPPHPHSCWRIAGSHLLAARACPWLVGGRRKRAAAR